MGKGRGRGRMKKPKPAGKRSGRPKGTAGKFEGIVSVARLAAIERHCGNVSAAAREWGMSRQALWGWLNSDAERIAWYGRMKKRKKWKRVGGNVAMRGWDAAARMAAIERHEGNIHAAEKELGLRHGVLPTWMKRRGERVKWYRKMEKRHGWQVSRGRPLGGKEVARRVRAIIRHEGNIRAAAKDVGRSQAPMWRWIEKNEKIKKWYDKKYPWRRKPRKGK